MADQNVFWVDGYQFNSMADVKLAELDKKKAAYFKDKLKGQNPRNILVVYNRMLDEGIFKTPIGWGYLKEIQEYLTDVGINPETIRPITVSQHFEKKKRDSLRELEREREAARQAETGNRLRLSMCFNVILVILVIAMFIITMQSDNPNILNYKRTITNQYAAWEEELTEREAAVREKEAALDISQN